MDAATQSLPDDVESLKALLLEKEAQLEAKDKLLDKKSQRVTFLEDYIRLMKYRQFGPSSERYTGQGELFNESEQLADESASDQAEPLGKDNPVESDNATNQEPQAKPGRKPLPEHLPRIKVYHELNDAETSCDCGYQMHAFDEVISEQLGVLPAELYAVQHCRKKYVCNQCEGKIKAAPLPAQPVPKSNATPELLAFIAVSKLLDGLPLYRQEKLWERGDIRLPRATMANWMITVGNHLAMHRIKRAVT